MLASTDAVLDYLQHLYNDTLDHDWINAVAAYNTGELGDKAAIDKNKSQGQTDGLWSLGIPAKRVQPCLSGWRLFKLFAPLIITIKSATDC